MKALVAGALVLALVIGGFALYGGRDQPADASASKHESAGALESGDESNHGESIEADALVERPSTETRPDPIPAARAQEEVSESGREEVAVVTLLSGRVVDSSGEPIEGAVVSWTSLIDELEVWERFATHFEDHARDNSLFSTTGPDGRFEFAQLPESLGESGSVLWVTHKAYGPGVRLLPGESPEPSAGLEFELEAGIPLLARVTDGTGQPVEGVTVHQQGLTMPDRAEAWPDGYGDRLSWLLYREFETDEEGIAELHDFSCEQVVQGRQGEQLTTTARGRLESRVDLQLLESLRVQVAVRYVEGRPDSVRPRAVFVAQIGQRRVELADVALDQAKDDFIVVPYLQADRYIVRLVSRVLVPEERHLRPRAPGEQLFVEFDGKRGSSLWFFAENKEGEPLTDAWAEFSWEQDGEWIRERVQASPDYPGYMHFVACPDGAINATVGCEGYIPQAHQTLVHPAPNEGTFVMILERGVKLRGRVVSGGDPVPNFVVATWSEGAEEAVVRETFHDREDGEFVLDGAFPGPSGLLVASKGVGISPVISFDPRLRPDDVLIVELPTGLRARGTIVDAFTGQPVTSATAQIYVEAGGVTAGALGAPIPVDSAGRLLIEGLSEEETRLRISAPGYAARPLEIRGGAELERDFGVVRLEPARTLTVRVVMPDGRDPSECDLLVNGPGVFDRPALGPDGSVTYEDVGLGAYSLVAHAPGRTSLHRVYTLGEDSTGVAVMDLSGSAGVQVSLETGRADQAFEGLVLVVQQQIVGVFQNWSSEISPEGLGEINGVPPGEHLVIIREGFSDSGRVHAMKLVELADGEVVALDIRLGDQDRYFRVVDANGEPVANASVRASPPGSTTWLGSNMATDGNGEFVLTSYEHETVTLSISHSVAGHLIGAQVRLDDPDEVNTIVLDGRNSVTVRIRDVNGPLEGMRPMLRDMAEQSEVFSTFTDADGSVTWSNLTDGTYRFVMIEDGYWLTHRRIEVFPGCGPYDVFAPRRCDLTVLATTNGLPRSDVQLEFTWQTQELSISQLIEWGFLESDRMDLTTGPDGRLSVWGIPEGSYAWRATTSGGITEGMLSISPDDQGVKVLELR